MGQVSYAWSEWVFCLESHKPEIKVSPEYTPFWSLVFSSNPIWLLVKLVPCSYKD